MKDETKADWRTLTSIPAGRRILAQLMDDLGLFTPPFALSHSDQTNYQCGRQAAAHLLKVRLDEVDPDLFSEIWGEHVRNKRLTQDRKNVERH